MGCIVALVAAFSARFALFLVWIFSDRLSVAFRSGWEGLLGFIFLPYTTLFYVLVYAPGHGVDAFGWLIVALGVVIDVSSHLFGSTARRRRSRRAVTKAT